MQEERSGARGEKWTDAGERGGETEEQSVCEQFGWREAGMEMEMARERGERRCHRIDSSRTINNANKAAVANYDFGLFTTRSGGGSSRFSSPSKPTHFELGGAAAEPGRCSLFLGGTAPLILLILREL